MHPQTRIDHRGARIVAHRARAAQMVDRTRLLAEILQEPFTGIHLRPRRNFLDRDLFQRRRCHHLAHQLAALDHFVDVLLRGQRVDADFRGVLRTVRCDLDRSAASRPARVECQQEARIRFGFEIGLIALRNPVRQRIEVQLQIRLRFLIVALEEPARLVHAHRERPLAREQILQTELELAKQRTHLVVQRLHVRAIVKTHTQMVLQILPHSGQILDHRDAMLRQQCAIAYARELQQLGRIDRARREDHLTVRHELPRSAVLRHAHADGPLVAVE